MTIHINLEDSGHWLYGISIGSIGAVVVNFPNLCSNIRVVIGGFFYESMNLLFWVKPLNLKMGHP